MQVFAQTMTREQYLIIYKISRQKEMYITHVWAILCHGDRDLMIARFKMMIYKYKFKLLFTIILLYALAVVFGIPFYVIGQMNHNWFLNDPRHKPSRFSSRWMIRARCRMRAYCRLSLRGRSALRRTAPLPSMRPVLICRPIFFPSIARAPFYGAFFVPFEHDGPRCCRPARELNWGGKGSA